MVAEYLNLVIGLYGSKVEQNSQALGFYQHIGFSIIGRSELDGQGKPYPLLHMELLEI